MDTPGDKAIDERTETIMNTTVTGFLGSSFHEDRRDIQSKEYRGPEGPRWAG